MELNQIRSQADINTIVRMTNKTDFDFTSEMGARYGGVPYFIPAGKSLLAPKPVAQHLAKHLARQSFIRKAPIRTASETDGKGQDRPLWTDEQVVQLAQYFLSDEYTESQPAPQSEEEKMRAKIEELNKTFEPVAPKVTDNAPNTPTSYKDKAEVIAELTKRGMTFDARMSKANLEKLLV